MTRPEFDEIVRATCPHCAKGLVARQRADNREWVHDFSEALAGSLGKRMGHTICMATHLRNSALAEGLTNA